MIVARIKYSCKLCSSKQFYIMPYKQKVKSGDYITSPDTFKVKCKSCGHEYVLIITLKEKK